MRWTFHVKRLHIERNNDIGISVLKDNPFESENLFITPKSETNCNGQPQPLKVSQPTPISLYQECIYTILVMRLLPETNLKTISSHNQTLTVQRVELSPRFTFINKHYGASGCTRPGWQPDVLYYCCAFWVRHLSACFQVSHHLLGFGPLSWPDEST